MPELVKLSQSSAVTDVCFPAHRNELFVTSGKENIHIWHTLSGSELLRITLANLTCLAVVVQPDGKRIISEWENGKIRAFLPETGKYLLFCLVFHFFKLRNCIYVYY